MESKKRTKEEQREYMRQWRQDHKEKVAVVNRRYYERNRGWLNKSRTRPWADKQVLKHILAGNTNYINIMLRIIRPEKDAFIRGDNNE